MNGKLIAMLAGSAVSGAAVGVVSTMHYFKKKYEAFAQKEIEDMRNCYYKMTTEYTPSEENQEPEKSLTEMDDEKRAEIKKKLKKNWSETTNYASYYKNKNQDEQEELVEDEPPVITPEEADERKKNATQSPRLVSVDSLEELPEYVEMEAMFYYTYDDTVTDENDQEIEDPGRYLGDCLTKYGFNENEETVIYVRNFELDKVYEVTKVDASYTTNKMYDGMYGDS